MSIPKHTPGPWTDQREHLLEDVGEGLKIRDRNRKQIVAVIRGPVKIHRSIEEWEANARLVAAAPELLELVETLAGYLESDERESVQRHVRRARDLANLINDIDDEPDERDVEAEHGTNEDGGSS